jgi:hypothetical protein
VRVHAPTAHARAVAPPAVEATLTVAARGTGLKLVTCALRSLGHGESRLMRLRHLESRARSPVPHLSAWTR